MKTLIILRHGKAESYNEDGDKVRKLTNRGLRDAEAMGTLIGEKVGAPDLVVSSDAMRARQTAVIAAKAAGYKGKIEYRAEIYEASVRTLFDVVRSLPKSAHSAMLIGHNPGFEELALDLIDGPLPLGSLPTAGVVILTLPSWADASPGEATLAGMYSPKSEAH